MPTPRAPHIRGPLVATICWALVALPIASLVISAVTLVMHGVDVPFWDDWRAYHSGGLGDFGLSYLFTPANDTLYPVGRVLDSAAQRWLHGHSIAYQLLSLVAIQGALLTLQWRLLAHCVADRLWRALAFSFTLPMLQPDSYWGLQNLAYHQAIPLVCVLSILVVTVSPKWKTHWAATAAAVLSLLSGMAYISGAFATLGLGCVLAIAAYACPERRSRLSKTSLAVLLPSVACTAAQLWVIAGVQKGTHLPGVLMAYPWHADFWWYALGKVGRALMLDRTQAALSATITIAVVVGTMVLALRVLRRRRSQADSALIYCALLVTVAGYLGLVAAGRANLRPDAVASGLQIFSFAFERFHFFWATLLWPWVVAALAPGTGSRASSNGRYRSALSLGAGLILVAMAGYGNAFGHDAHYAAVMGLREQGIDCINDSVGTGRGPIACPTLHPIDTPELLPDDLTQSIKHAIANNASFTRQLKFPVIPLNAAEPPALFRLESASQIALENLNTTALPDQYVAMPLQLNSTGEDPSASFSTGHAEALRRCLILDVVVDMELTEADTAQLYYIPGGSNRYTEANSAFTAYIGPGSQNLAFRLISAQGFTDHFRFDPATKTGPVTISGLEVRCRFPAPQLY